jgi:DNA polymerase-3 subunit epsilon
MNDSITLSNLNVLALDCQATGANPGKGHLLEIGWMPGRAASSSTPERYAPESYLTRSQAQMPISPVIQRLTGISDATMTDAVAVDIVWRQLKKTGQAIAARNQSMLCPAVIHFAQFEAPFLRQLHETNDPGTQFPFQIICTHAIATRLLPELPRRGIRALAGYLGHSMPEFKRSADHALATLIIWKAMVELLLTRFKVDSMQQLDHWLASTRVQGRVKRNFPMHPKIRQSLPQNPGVYRMRCANADILYIGKAKSLKQRVSSYFRDNAAHPEHIIEMLSQAWDIDYSLTESALEAAVLESDEIKHHRPPYNKALRADRRSLVFCTRDLKQHAPSCDHHFSIGPLPDGRLIDAIEAFGSWLACDTGLTGDALFRMGYPFLAHPSDRTPEIQCLKDGFDFFRSSHRRYLQNRSALRIVTSLGALLQRQQLENSTDTQVSPDLHTKCSDGTSSEEAAAVRAFAWSPADIAGAIESTVMRSAHMIRRARWYCLLSESCIAWASEDDPGVLKNLLAFEKGGISHRGVLEAGQKVPAPPGFGRPWLDRRNNLDLTTYDRMRVVTTELRRLVSKGRKIELRLGPKVSMSSSELKKVMKWV